MVDLDRPFLYFYLNTNRMQLFCARLCPYVLGGLNGFADIRQNQPSRNLPNRGRRIVPSEPTIVIHDRLENRLGGREPPSQNPRSPKKGANLRDKLVMTFEPPRLSTIRSPKLGRICHMPSIGFHQYHLQSQRFLSFYKILKISHNHIHSYSFPSLETEKYIKFFKV